MDKILAVDSFARPLRAVAVLIAITALAWEFVERLAGNPVADTEIVTRAITAGVALAIAWLSSTHRSAATLRLLAFGLGVAIAGGEWVILGISPRESWVSITVLTAVIGGSALFIPWAWRWQALFAGTIDLGAVITLLLVSPSRGLSYPEIAYATTLLTAVGVASVIGAAHTDRERRRVAQSEAVYRSLFESAGDAIAVLDADGVVRQVNRRFEQLLGVPIGAAIGRRLRDFYPPAPAPDSGGATHEHAAALSGEVGHASHALVRADGTQLDVDITFARSEGPSGPVVQAILRDLTDMRAHERRQIQEERLDSLARFAGGIAHQFNNIIGGILTHASVLRSDAANEGTARELDEILTEARRGRELTKELLRFTRHEVVVLQPTALAAVLESVTALARTTLPQAVAIDAGVPDGLPAVLGDADHLIHAALQIVLNARDSLAGRPNGRLTIHAGVETVSPDDLHWPEAAPGRYIRLSIGNNGPGMDAATLGRVFEPFFTTKPMYQAAGIGLATVRAVMRDHHGVAKVESTPPPGLGTVVHLLIPVAPPGTAAPLTPAVVAPVAAAERTATILIVDDEAIVRSSLRRALTRFGYKVLEAGDGGTALAELQAAHPPVDLVILDLVLPGGGAGVFEILKSVRPDLRVLVSSGYSPDADNAKALAAKAQGFLGKPYEIKELREAVARALAVPL